MQRVCNKAQISGNIKTGKAGLDFVTNCVKEPPQFWNQILCIKKLEKQANDEILTVWRRIGTAYEPNYTSSCVKHVKHKHLTAVY